MGWSHVSDGDEFEYLVPIETATYELHVALTEAGVSHLVAPGKKISRGVDLCVSPDTAIWLANLVQQATRGATRRS
ncbi:hypothetical protein [Streptomyces sp. NPDC047315]|uniref:hypothetical protein n=1 Tax=Streptomyces sp. NPDC047315 TaxID=3155142 RepID=UPI0033CB49B5